MADPVGHPINHLDEPGACLGVIVNSTQELPARICAALDLLHWGSRTFLPHSAPDRLFTGVMISPDMSEADLCTMLAREESSGFGAIDWKAWLEVFKPVILELLKRWLLS